MAGPPSENNGKICFQVYKSPKSRIFSTFGDFCTRLFAKIWNFSHFWQTIIRNNIVLRYATSTTFITPFGVLKNQHSGLVNNEVVLDDLFD